MTKDKTKVRLKPFVNCSKYLTIVVTHVFVQRYNKSLRFKTKMKIRIRMNMANILWSGKSNNVMYSFFGTDTLPVYFQSLNFS